MEESPTPEREVQGSNPTTAVYCSLSKTPKLPKSTGKYPYQAASWCLMTYCINHEYIPVTPDFYSYVGGFLFWQLQVAQKGNDRSPAKHKSS